MTKLNKNELVLLIIDGLKICISAFTGPFLVSFFISLTLSNIASYSIYKIITYLVTFVFSFLISRLIKKKSKIVSFRLGILTNIFYLLSFVVLKEQMINKSFILGIFLGLSNAFYYMPFNYIFSNEVRDVVLTKWSSYKGNINNIVNIILPIVIGILLTYFDYYDIAVIFVVVQLIALVLSFLLKTKEKQLPTFSIRKYFDAIKKNNQLSNFKKIFAIEFLNGFTISGSALQSVITIFVMLSFKTDLNLGIFTSVFTIINFVIASFLSKIKDKSNFSKIMFISIALIIPSIVYFILSTSKFSFIAYNFSYNIAYVVISIITYVITFNTTNCVSDIKKNYQLEHLSTREAFLSFGRILSFILLVITSLFDNIFFYKVLIGIYSLALIIMNYLVYDIYKK